MREYKSSENWKMAEERMDWEAAGGANGVSGLLYRKAQSECLLCYELML